MIGDEVVEKQSLPVKSISIQILYQYLVCFTKIGRNFYPQSPIMLLCYGGYIVLDVTLHVAFHIKVNSYCFA